MDGVGSIEVAGEVVALILRGDFSREGVHFITPGALSQQLAYLRHPAGKIIEPHVHNQVKREVLYTNEVLREA